jgi:hypothetical protein
MRSDRRRSGLLGEGRGGEADQHGHGKGAQDHVGSPLCKTMTL